jgi:hypothetical protein
MPTSLPISLSAEIVDRTGLPRVQGAVWLVVVWAVAMLFFAALANFGTETGAMDPFQLLANF